MFLLIIGKERGTRGDICEQSMMKTAKELGVVSNTWRMDFDPGVS